MITKSVTNLSSKLRKQKSLLKGYKEKNDTLVATLRTNVNKARAKIPELCREHRDSTTGLVMSIKTLKFIVQEIQAQAATGHPIAHQVNQGTTHQRPPVGPVDPPPMPVHTRTTCFQTTDGLSPTFQGVVSFPPGNQCPCVAGLPTATGYPHAGRTADADGNTPPDSTPPAAMPSPMARTQEGFHWDPSAINLASLGSGTPPPFNHRVGLNTPDHMKAPDNNSDQQTVGGPIKSPRPSDKECLA
jgi:hypothetical protein